MQNYHKHTYYSHIFISADSPVSQEDYAKRCKELGHKVLSSVEHGWQGNYFETFELAKKYDLKCVIGSEVYWVQDRQKEYPTDKKNKAGEVIYNKDKSNNHLVILAKNNNGRECLNDILSEANISGYYYRPRVDLELILSLPSDDVFITSACIAFNGYGYEKSDEIILKLHNKFKNNFMLEIQYHNTDMQKEWNKHLLELSEKYGIQLIVGLDSHYIYPEQEEQRDFLLKYRGISYDNEIDWYMDYPDDKTVMDRFLEQGIFTKEQIQKAMDNTDIILSFEDYDDLPIFNKDIKLPTLYPNLSTEEKEQKYVALITNKFKEYAKKNKLSKEDIKKYKQGIQMEINTYKDTGMVDYPLIDYEIVKKGIEKGGLITNSGRGCFTGDALIRTKKGLKRLDKIKIGDEVKDMYGKYQVVTDTFCYNIKEPLIKIHHYYKSHYFSTCTLDHKLFVCRNLTRQWIEAQDLRDGDYLCLPNALVEIKSIEYLPPKKTKVYDITVKNSHSYILNDMIVHNSAVGYFTNTLCGFSQIDRFKADIKLYPERFISTTRILETKSLPDIDLNISNLEAFEEAQREVLGESHVFPMIAYGTLQKKAAFKLCAKVNEIDFKIANEVSEQIGEYEKALKDADGEEINIEDYIDKEYLQYIEMSENFENIVSDKKKAPSAYLLYQGDIRREIGLIKCKSSSTKKEYIVCCMDGATAENFKFLKNDLLIVNSILLINKVFERIGIPIFDVNTLLEKTKNNKKVWDIYANGYCIGVNQVEQDASKSKAEKYKPSSIAELSAFVAACRPGFKSMYKKFENRENFSWGIKSLDNLIRTEQLPVSFLFFQEQVMSVLNYAGFPMDECYGIIKAIAKKHPEKVKPLKSKFIKGFKDKLIEVDNLSEKEAQENSEKVWQIINDNCSYSFNSSHAYCMAVDSLYQAWQKAEYPYEFYEVLLQYFSDKGRKDKVALLKNEMKVAFGISEGKYKFREDNRKFKLDKKNKCIYPSLSSIKGLNNTVANSLYSLRNNEYPSFYELLVDLKKTKIVSTKVSQKLEALIKINYFSEFGDINELLKKSEVFFKLYGRKSINKNNLEEYELPEYLIEKYSTQTEKTYKDIDCESVIKAMFEHHIEFEKCKFSKRLEYEYSYLGYINSTSNKIPKDYYFVESIQNNLVNLVNLQDGSKLKIKYRRGWKSFFSEHPFKEYDIIHITDIHEENKKQVLKDEDGKPILTKTGKKRFIEIDEQEPILGKWNII